MHIDVKSATTGASGTLKVTCRCEDCVRSKAWAKDMGRVWRFDEWLHRVHCRLPRPLSTWLWFVQRPLCDWNERRIQSEAGES